MKNKKNTFILWVICCLIGIIAFQIFQSHRVFSGNTDSYLLLLSGNALLNNISVQQDIKEEVVAWDEIRVLGGDSLAVIHWGDGSITRLAANTKIQISEAEVSSDITNIQISFDLLAGKTWSHIVSFIWGDSYFTQSFQGVEAWVRGTVFSVDLTEDVLQVIDHAVSLSNQSWVIQEVQEWQILELSSFSLVELTDFLENMRDDAWIALNTEYDIQYMSSLRDELVTQFTQNVSMLRKIRDMFSQKHHVLTLLQTAQSYETIEEKIAEIPPRKYQSIYQAVLSEYQNIHFIEVKDYEFYKRKVFYQKALVSLGTETQQEALLQSTLYDIQDMIELEDISLLENLQSLLQTQQDFIPEGLQEEFQKNMNTLQNIINSDMLENINFENIDSAGREALQNIDGNIQNFLDVNFWEFIENVR